jgi:hypothetical protein
MRPPAAAQRVAAPPGRGGRAQPSPTNLAGSFKRFRTALSSGSHKAGAEQEADDPYKTLRVDPGADLAAITSAFRSLLKAALLEGNRTTAASLERAYSRIRASLPGTPEREPLRRIR